MSHSIIVIGSGIIGTSTTLTLQNQGHQVLNISKCLKQSDTASFSNGCTLVRNPQPKSIWTIFRHLLLGNMSLKGISRLRSYQCIKTPPKEHRTAFSKLCQQSLFLFKTQKWDKHVFLKEKQYHYVDSHQLNQQMKQDSIQKGAIYVEDEIMSFESQKNKITAIKGMKDTYHADKVILCAGCDTTTLAKQMGIEVPILPVYGYSVEGFCSRPISASINKSGLETTLSFGHKVRLVYGADLVPIERFEWMKKRLKDQFPNVKKVQEWTGIRPMTYWGVPFISRTKFKNLFINAGHGTTGVTTCLGSAQLLSQMINHQETFVNEKYFSINR